jgi:hypothetical protein
MRMYFLKLLKGRKVHNSLFCNHIAILMKFCVVAMGRELLSFQFDMAQVDAFKYRVNDALRAVTKSAIKEARLKEIKQEILNSEKLKVIFIVYLFCIASLLNLVFYFLGTFRR